MTLSSDSRSELETAALSLQETRDSALDSSASLRVEAGERLTPPRGSAALRFANAIILGMALAAWLGFAGVMLFHRPRLAAVLQDFEVQSTQALKMLLAIPGLFVVAIAAIAVLVLVGKEWLPLSLRSRLLLNGLGMLAGAAALLLYYFVALSTLLATISQLT